MLERPDAVVLERILSETTENWLAALNAALTGDAPYALAGCSSRTATGGTCSASPGNLRRSAAARGSPASCWRGRARRRAGFRVDTSTLAPRTNVVAGHEVIEAIFRFEAAWPRLSARSGCCRKRTAR